MHSITDYITVSAFLYFFLRGWQKGFLRTILGPISMVVGCLIGYSYYQKNPNIGMALTISILSPFLINLLASIVLKTWNKTVNSDIPPSHISRSCASAFSILWGGAYLIMLIILIAISPLKFGWIEKAQNDVLASRTYAFINENFGDKIPNGFLNIKKVANVLQDPEKLEAFEESEEFKAIQADTRLKDLIEDEDTARQIRDKDYTALLANPKIRAIFNDKEFLRKIFALNKRIVEEAGKAEPETLKEEF